MTRKIRNLRYLLIVVLAAISLAGTAVCWLGPKSDRGVMFAGIFLLAVQVAAGGLAVGLASSNISGHTKKATVSATTFVGYCKNSHSIYEMITLTSLGVGNVIGPVIFGASPGPLYHAGFMGSFICLCGAIGIAIITVVLLWMENRRRDRVTGGPTYAHNIDEDLTDKQNEDFRYVL